MPPPKGLRDLLQALFGPLLAYMQQAYLGMKSCTANKKTAFGATAALSLLVIVALLSYHHLSEWAGVMAVLITGLVAGVIHREMRARQNAENGLLRAQETLERRVIERTTEINTANVALQAEVLERQRAEEALRRAHDELELRVTERTRELADANSVLEREILERRQITEALKNSRTLYHSLVEHLPVNVWRTDVSGRFTFVNEHLCDCHGVTHEDFLSRTAYDFYTKSTAERHVRGDQCVITTGEPFEELQEFETRNGRQGFEQVLKTPYHDGKGRVLGVQGISWDITERKRAEEEMRRIQRQLEQTNSDLRRRNDEVQSFYHTLSHELKTPLTSAREFVAIVMDGLAGKLNPSQAEYLTIALESCDQLTVCINDLLDATRLETGKLSIDLKPARLGALVQRTVTAMSPVAKAKDIELTCEVEPDLPELPLDDNRIAQVVTNLLNNAVKFTEPTGRVCVTVRSSPEDDDVQEVVVQDTGRGIPQEELDRIFDRLYQLKSGETATERGVGLGLYLCRELVRLHGGEIDVESELGVGSTFTFSLGQQDPLRRYNLLLVDDDPALRDILCKVLEKADFEVATAEDGQAALLQIHRRIPDAVLMDLEMPVMDGPTAIQEIRKQWGEIPVVIHTGCVEGPLLNRALQLSPSNVVPKPCPMEQLVQIMLDLKPVRSASRHPAARLDAFTAKMNPSKATPVD